MDHFISALKTLAFGLVCVIIAAWIQWDDRSLANRIDSQVRVVKSTQAYKQILVWGERGFDEAKGVVSGWLGIKRFGHFPRGDSISREEQERLRSLLGDASN